MLTSLQKFSNWLLDAHAKPEADAALQAWRDHEAECRRLEAEYAPQYDALAAWYQRIVKRSVHRSV